MGFGSGIQSPGESGLHITGTVDASLEANLPTLADNAAYRVTVAGSFGGSVLINPAGFYFDIGDLIVANGTSGKWDAVDANDPISDEAYGVTWDGITRMAPSKNAVYDGLNGHIILTGTSVHGLGTMSTQNANNVAITGGAIDGTTIGSTTPAAVTGTTVSTSTAAAHLDISGTTVTADGSDTNINVTLTPKGTAGVVVGNGSATNAGLGFAGANNTGFYWAGGLMYAAVAGGNACNFSTTGVSVQSGKSLSSPTVITPAINTADNAAALTINLPVTGADAGAHTVAVNLDSTTIISATGTATAGAIGAKALTVGASGDTIALAGTTTAATAASGTNTTQVATTAFSNAAAVKYGIVFGG